MNATALTLNNKKKRIGFTRFCDVTPRTTCVTWLDCWPPKQMANCLVPPNSNCGIAHWRSQRWLWRPPFRSGNKGYQGSGVACPQCGENAKFLRWQAKTSYAWWVRFVRREPIITARTAIKVVVSGNNN
jgi:hypothetical protein